MSSNVITALVSLTVIWYCLLPVAGLQCPGCGDKLDCPSVVDCRGGTVPDRCGCCLECARVTNQTCGGRYRSEGKCDEGLVCVITPRPGAVITGEEVGMCRVIPAPIVKSDVAPSGVDQLNCNAVDCDKAGDHVVPQCPPDSLPAPLRHDLTASGGECCEGARPRLACQCLPCEDAVCGPTEVRLLVEEAVNTPGHCCDVYQCLDQSLFCGDVDCSDVYTQTDDVASPCPADSFRPAPLVSQDGCCVIHQRCQCKGEESCEDVTCRGGLEKRVVQQASGLPGSCCSTYDCINGSSVACVHNGTSYGDGDTWTSVNCDSCTCRDGLSFCRPLDCPQLDSCGWVGTVEGRCCPVCKGCVTERGDLQPSGTVWQHDSCVTCRCDDGRVYCQAQLCSVNCDNPRNIPGECCAVCDDAESETVKPAAKSCPSLAGCTLMCVNGYVRQADGCYVCQCVEPDHETCELQCLHGFRRDLLGREVCDCAADPVSSSTQSPSPPHLAQPTCPPLIGCTKDCLYGYRTDRYGCSRCRCNRCPPFICAKKCRDGFAHSSDGCRLCRCLDTFVETTSRHMDTSSARPVSAVGRRCVVVDREEGQSWWEDGESWWDGCRRCFCHDGHEMCALITCPTLRCINPLLRSGACCPSCPGDAVLLPFASSSLCHLGNGRYYGDGDTWKLDDCTLCLCHEGTPLCVVDSCQPILCHHPVVIPSLCCPVCPDETGFLPNSALQPLRSVDKPCRSAVTGRRYASGDSWRVDVCQSCTCHAGQIVCFSQTCPILACNKSVLKKGHCCPICISGATFEYCTYKADVYSVGESWLVDECTHCTCLQGGQVLCSVTVCEISSTAQCSSAAVDDFFTACCPVCRNETSRGDAGLESSQRNVTGVGEGRAGLGASSTTTTLIVLIVLLSVVVMLLLLLLVVYWRRLRGTIYRHHSSLTKSTASSPLGPPRYVADSQLSSVMDCSDLDVHSSSWAGGSARPLKPINAEEEADGDDRDGRSCSPDSVDKPPLLETRSNVSSPSVSCEQLSTLDCDTVDDDDVTSPPRHDDVTVQRALCRYSW